MHSSAKKIGAIAALGLTAGLLAACSSASSSTTTGASSGASSVGASAAAASDATTPVDEAAWIKWANEGRATVNAAIKGAAFTMTVKSSMTSDGKTQSGEDNVTVNPDGSRVATSVVNGESMELLCVSADKCWGRYVGKKDDTKWHAFPAGVAPTYTDPLGGDYSTEVLPDGAKFFQDGSQGLWSYTEPGTGIETVQRLSFSPTGVTFASTSTYPKSESSPVGETNEGLAVAAASPVTVAEPAASDIGEPLDPTLFKDAATQ